METLLLAQITFGVMLGCGVWIATYSINRAWLGFWSFLR